MNIVTDSITLSARGQCDMKDITSEISKKLTEHGMEKGIVTIFVPGSTCGLTTIEYESGLIADFEALMEKVAPSNVTYHHDARWGDGNGFSHIRSSLIGPSLTVPFAEGQLILGTWQQIVFVDFDNRSRNRQLILQFMGE